MSSPRRPALAYAALIGLALIWGASFLFIKVAVRDMSPEVLLLLRSASGLLTLAVIVRAMGRPLLSTGWRSRLVSFTIMAVVLLHGSLSGPIVAGMVVILAGIVLTNLRRQPRREPAAERYSAAA